MSVGGNLDIWVPLDSHTGIAAPGVVGCGATGAFGCESAQNQPILKCKSRVVDVTRVDLPARDKRSGEIYDDISGIT